MSTLSHYQCVDEFHRVFGHPRPSTPQRDIFTNTKLVNMRISLITEEHSEFTDAVASRDIVGVLDALSDILYVTHGMGIVFGIDLGRHELDEFDSDKIDLTLFNDDASLNQVTEALQLSIDAIRAACNQADFDKVSDALGQLLDATYRAAWCFALPIDRAFRLVHDNNMSKLCKTEADAIQSVAFYAEQPAFKDIVVNYRQSDDGKYFVMYNDTPGHPQNGKILKAHTWREPDFAPLIHIADNTDMLKLANLAI